MKKNKKVTEKTLTKTTSDSVKFSIVKLGSVTKLTGGIFSNGEAEGSTYYPKASKT